MIIDNKKQTLEETNEPIEKNCYTRLKKEYAIALEEKAPTNYQEYLEAKKLLKSKEYFDGKGGYTWYDISVICTAIKIKMENFPLIFD